MPSKIQGRLCANNAEAIQSLNTTIEQLSEQLHEVHLNPMFTELIRTLQELRAKLASRDDEIERLVERVTRLERGEARRLSTLKTSELPVNAGILPAGLLPAHSHDIRDACPCWETGKFVSVDGCWGHHRGDESDGEFLARMVRESNAQREEIRRRT